MIKAVLFDADGVLIQTELATVELERRYGIPESQSQEFFSREWDKCLVGQADSKEVLAPYLQKWGWPSNVEDYLRFWFDFENKQDAQLLEFIQTLRSQAIRCYLATNQDVHRAQYMLEEMGFAEAFDEAFISSRLGHAKPSRRYFEIILEQLPFSSDEILFWDDREENVAAAKELNMNAEIYSGMREFTRIMKEEYGL